MREILFKAKSLDNGEWVEGFYLNLRNKYHYILTGKLDIVSGCPNLVKRSVDPETICQYTGLTDKNGKKIWENDIVKEHFGEDIALIRFGKYQNCFDTQKTGHVGFYVDWKRYSMRKDLGYWIEMIDCNVIGNIFDNPELVG